MVTSFTTVLSISHILLSTKHIFAYLVEAFCVKLFVLLSRITNWDSIRGFPVNTHQNISLKEMSFFTTLATPQILSMSTRPNSLHASDYVLSRVFRCGLGLKLFEAFSTILVLRTLLDITPYYCRRQNPRSRLWPHWTQPTMRDHSMTRGNIYFDYHYEPKHSPKSTRNSFIVPSMVSIFSLSCCKICIGSISGAAVESLLHRPSFKNRLLCVFEY